MLWLRGDTREAKGRADSVLRDCEMAKHVLSPPTAAVPHGRTASIAISDASSHDQPQGRSTGSDCRTLNFAFQAAHVEP